MSRRRRAVLLLGLAVLLGGLAASDVAQREAALRERLGPAVPVVVARQAIPAGAELTRERLGVRRVPARYAPAGAAAGTEPLLGARVAVPVAAGGVIAPELLRAEAAPRTGPVRRGERVADLTAAGSPQLVQPGGRVDVLVTREGPRDTGGATELALEDVEVLSAAPAGEEGSAEHPGPRVATALRVTVRQAVYLAAAQSFAREVRLLARPTRDHRRGKAGLTVGAELG